MLLISIMAVSGCTSTPSVSPIPPQIPIVIETGATENITATSAILRATLTSVDPSEGALLSFVWGKTKELGEITKASSPYYKAGNYSFELKNLAEGTTFWVKAKAEGKAITYGMVVEFKTLTLPKVETLPAQEIGVNTAKLITRIPSVGSAKVIRQYFEYGIDDLSKKSRVSQFSQAGTVTAQLTGLESGKTYQFRSVIESGDLGRVDGSLMTFTTKKAPTVSQVQVRNISATSAQLISALEELAGAKTVTLCFEYSDDQGHSFTTPKVLMSAPGPITGTISDLIVGSKYSCRVKTESGEYGVSRSETISFTTTTAKELFPVNEGHGVKYRVTDTEFNLDSDIWAVSQHRESAKWAPDFFITVISEKDRRLPFAANSIGGYLNYSNATKPLNIFSHGYPQANQGNMFFYVCVPQGVKVGENWTFTDNLYVFEKAGPYTVAGKEYQDTITISFVTLNPSEEYFNGKGYFVIAKGVGMVELVFKRNSGREVVFSCLESRNFPKYVISGSVESNNKPLQDLWVYLANADWGSGARVDESGRFSIQCYGPDMILRFGYDKNKDGEFDFDYYTPYEYTLKGIRNEISGLQIRLY